MYILAQFSERTSFDWVQKLRSKTGKDEIKHADVVSAQSVWPADKEFWRSVDRGIEEATIYVVDPATYVRTVLSELLGSGAELGYDFDQHTAIDMAAEQIIKETPGYQLTNTRAALEFASLRLPYAMMSTGLQFMACQTDLPVPREVLTRLGGGLRHAIRFAARSQSLFDAEMLNIPDLETLLPYYAPDSWTEALRTEWRLRTALSTPRVFDVEDIHSIEVLNETADWMRDAMSRPPALRPLIREVDSASIDAIQAADIAAGTARNIIDHQGARALAGKFRRVFVNGTDLHILLRHS